MPSSPFAFKTLAALYGIALVVLVALDALWLGLIARPFYRREMGALLNESVRLGPAFLFYLAYPAGLVYLALQPGTASLAQAAMRCAVVGLVAYGAYDLTNLATLRGWSLRMSVVDVLWGAFVSTAAGAAAWWFIVGRP